MADAGQKDQFCPGNMPDKIIGVFALDELIVLAVHDGNRHIDLGEIGDGVVRLGPLHQADSLDEGIEPIRRGGKSCVILRMAIEAPTAQAHAARPDAAEEPPSSTTH